MSLKNRTLRGFSWVFVDRFANKFIQFVIGIILARLLTPEEYGLIGMLAIFLAISDTFIVTGFGEALVQKKNPTRADYSTILITNIFTGCFFYALFYCTAPLISSFFNEPRLEPILIIFSLSIIINSFGIVPRVPLVRRLDFKVLTVISVFATLISGIAAIILAFLGYGVWSLVWRSIVMSLVTTIAVNWYSRLRLDWKFHWESFREMFKFGSNLMASRLLNEVYENLYYVVIGKYFSAQELGLYTKANGFKDLPSKTLYHIINSVSFSALSRIKDEEKRLKTAFQRLLQVTMFLALITMFGLAGAADNFIVGLIGEQWSEAVVYLQLLCFVGVAYPLIHLNMSLWVVKGHSNQYLQMEVIMKVMAVPVIIVSAFLGIIPMLIGLILISAVNAYLTLQKTAKLIDYSVKQQVKDNLPSFLTGVAVGLLLLLLGRMDLAPLLELFIQGVCGLLFVIVISSIWQLQPFLELKKIADNLIQSKLKSNR